MLEHTFVALVNKIPVRLQRISIGRFTDNPSNGGGTGREELLSGTYHPLQVCDTGGKLHASASLTQLITAYESDRGANIHSS